MSNIIYRQKQKKSLPILDEEKDFRCGAIFNQTAEWGRDILIPAGWILVAKNEDGEFWRRPGKDEGSSARIYNNEGIEVLYVYTKSTALQYRETYYSKFRVYTRFFHHVNGKDDFSAACMALCQKGFVANQEYFDRQKKKLAIPTEQQIHDQMGEDCYLLRTTTDPYYAAVTVDDWGYNDLTEGEIVNSHWQSYTARNKITAKEFLSQRSLPYMPKYILSHQEDWI